MATSHYGRLACTRRGTRGHEDADEVGIHCRLRLSLLMGNVLWLVAENEEDVERLRELYAGSDVEPYVDQLRAAEEELKAMQAKVKALRKALSRALE